MPTPTSQGRIDRPYRAPPKDSTAEDLRRALDRTNERIDALLRRVEHIEDLLVSNSLWTDP